MANRRRVDRADQTRAALSWARRATRVSLQVVSLASFLAALGYGGREGYRFATTSPHFAITSISIDGNAHASPDELRRLLGVTLGDNLFLADLADAKARVERHPWIRSATIERRFPQAVEVVVLEREAAALVDLENLYLLDAKGEVFKRALAGDPLDLPVITGVPRETWRARPDEAHDRLLEALEVLRKYGETRLAKTHPAAEVHHDPADGITLYLGTSGPSVQLGRGELDAKLSRLSRVMEELEQRGARAEVLRLDNRARPGWIAARLATKSGDDG